MDAAQDHIKTFIIAAHGDLETVRRMLAGDPALLNVAYEWRPGDTEDALQAAGHVGHRAIAEYVLDQGAPLTVFAAAMLGRADDVRRFLAENPILATTPGVHGISLLWHAALSGRTEITQIVLDHGGQVTPHDLHAAASQGHLDMARWLFAHGANDFSVRNFQGKTPLEVAEARGDAAFVKMLQDHAGESA